MSGDVKNRVDKWLFKIFKKFWEVYPYIKSDIRDVYTFNIEYTIVQIATYSAGINGLLIV